MKFIKSLYIASIFGVSVSCVHATVEIGFSKQGEDNFEFSCSYNGVNRESTSKIGRFASIINDLHGDAISVVDVDREAIGAGSDFYTIGDGNEACDLIIFDELKTSKEISQLSFNGSNVCGNPASIQFNYNSAGNMKLPIVDSHNIALLRVNIKNKNSTIKCEMDGLKTDKQIGIMYNNKLRINGRTFNDLEGNNGMIDGYKFVVANSGVNSFAIPSSKVVALGGESGEAYAFVEAVHAGKNQYLKYENGKVDVRKEHRTCYAELKKYNDMQAILNK